ERAELHRFHRRVEIGAAGDEDRRCLEAGGARFTEHREAVEVRNLDVDHEAGRLHCLLFRQVALGGRERPDAIPAIDEHTLNSARRSVLRSVMRRRMTRGDTDGEGTASRSFTRDRHFGLALNAAAVMSLARQLSSKARALSATARRFALSIRTTMSCSVLRES